MSPYPKCPTCRTGRMVPGFTSAPACNRGVECAPDVDPYEDTGVFMFDTSPLSCTRCRGSGMQTFNGVSFYCTWCTGTGYV